MGKMKLVWVATYYFCPKYNINKSNTESHKYSFRRILDSRRVGCLGMGRLGGWGVSKDGASLQDLGVLEGRASRRMGLPGGWGVSEDGASLQGWSSKICLDAGGAGGRGVVGCS